jgi:hypothetical protein
MITESDALSYDFFKLIAIKKNNSGIYQILDSESKPGILIDTSVIPISKKSKKNKNHKTYELLQKIIKYFTELDFRKLFNSVQIEQSEIKKNIKKCSKYKIKLVETVKSDIGRTETLRKSLKQNRELRLLESLLVSRGGGNIGDKEKKSDYSNESLSDVNKEDDMNLNSLLATAFEKHDKEDPPNIMERTIYYNNMINTPIKNHLKNLDVVKFVPFETENYNHNLSFSQIYECLKSKTDNIYDDLTLKLPFECAYTVDGDRSLTNSERLKLLKCYIDFMKEILKEDKKIVSSKKVKDPKSKKAHSIYEDKGITRKRSKESKQSKQSNQSKQSKQSSMMKSLTSGFSVMSPNKKNKTRKKRTSVEPVMPRTKDRYGSMKLTGLLDVRGGAVA